LLPGDYERENSSGLKYSLLNILRCPDTKSDLKLEAEDEVNGEVKEGRLRNSAGKVFPIKNYVPRFVESDEYVSSFSYEWMKHKKTQFDDNPINKGRRFTEEFFMSVTGLDQSKTTGKLFLDVGVGSGRYADVVSQWGGEVVGVDLSLSVEAAMENIGGRKNVNIVQADLFRLPFKENVFDIVFSIGVLHHTPSAKDAFEQLPQYLKKDGVAAVWLYNAYNRMDMRSKNFWRYILRRLPKRLLYTLSFMAVPLSYLYRIPLLGGILYYAFPIIQYTDRNWRWIQLDTFDLYSPHYMTYHTYAEVFQWFKENNFREIEIAEPAVAVRGVKN
jgi:SAM-dependent methyltransferase